MLRALRFCKCRRACFGKLKNIFRRTAKCLYRNDLQVSLVVQSYFPVGLTVSFSFQRYTAMSQPPSKSVPESRKGMTQWDDADWSPFLHGIDHVAQEAKHRAVDARLLKQCQEAVAERIRDLEQSTSTSSTSQPKEG